MQHDSGDREIPELRNAETRRRTVKFWIAPDGRMLPLKGLWHYQWALRHALDEGIDLDGHTTEEPVRLRMLAHGWWRVNYQRRPARLVVEGDASGLNGAVQKTLLAFVEVNQPLLNRLDLHVLASGMLRDRIVLKHPFTPDEFAFPCAELDRFLDACGRR